MSALDNVLTLLHGWSPEALAGLRTIVALGPPGALAYGEPGVLGVNVDPEEGDVPGEGRTHLRARGGALAEARAAALVAYRLAALAAEVAPPAPGGGLLALHLSEPERTRLAALAAARRRPPERCVRDWIAASQPGGSGWQDPSAEATLRELREREEPAGDRPANAAEERAKLVARVLEGGMKEYDYHRAHAQIRKIDEAAERAR